MQSLPVKARRFLFVIYALGVATLAAVVVGRGLWVPDTPGGAWEMIAFAIAGAFAGQKKVQLMRHTSKLELGSMSLGFLVIFTALLRLGPPGALLMAAISNISSNLFPKPKAWHQFAFNLAITLFAALCCAEVYVWLNSLNALREGRGLTLAPDWRTTPPAVLASSLAFFFLNTGAVAGIVGLVSDRNIFRVWVDSFLFTAPSFFLSAGIATVAVAVLGDNMLMTLACLAPVALFMFLSYRGYAERTEALLKSKDEMAELYLQTVRSLALAIDAKDQYTHQHIVRVQQYAVATARAMGLPETDIKAIEMSALLHDIGKLGVPEYVLLKPGKLTPEEFAKIKEHPRIGADILDPVKFPWPVLPGVKHHHERWDGGGYPDGLAGEGIPLQGRILAVADVYDALTSNRSYRNAWTHEKAKEEIARNAGKHFDPVIAAAFLRVVDQTVAEMAVMGYGPLTTPPPTVPAAGPRPLQGGATPADAAVRDIQRASSELWALYEVAQTLSASVGLRDTLDILARKLEAILPGAACVFLIREDADAPSYAPADAAASAVSLVGSDGILRGHSDAPLVARAAVGVDREFFEGCRTGDVDSLSRRALRDGLTYRGGFDPEDLIPDAAPGTAWMPLRSALIVPIIHQGQRLGTINVYHPEEDAFGLADQHFLERIAERAALALWNGLLFDRTRSDALTDPLTGLANVRRLTGAIEELCARGASAALLGAPPVRFALLCLDLDAFKPINDNFGHQKGDEVLRALSELFARTVGDEGIVARYGGDEFLVVLEGADPRAAEGMADRLQRAVSGYDPGLIHPRLGPLRLSASIGWACFPEEGDDGAALLSVADAAMYRAKAERKLGRLVGAMPTVYGAAVAPSSAPAGPSAPEASPSVALSPGIK